MTDNNYLAVKEGAVWGTAVVPDVYIDIVSESLGENHNIVKDSGVSGKVLNADVGGFEIAGNVVVEAKPDNIGELLAWSLGADTAGAVSVPTGCSASYNHVIKRAATRPFFSTEVGISNPVGIVDKLYDSMMVDSVAVPWAPDAPLAMDFAMRGRSIDISDTTPGSPSFSTLGKFMGHMAAIKIDGAANANVEKVDFTISNNLIRKPEANSIFPGQYKPGEFMIAGALDVSFEDTVLFKKFLGGASQTTPATSLGNFDLELLYTHYEVLEVCDSDASYLLSLDMPTCRYTTHNANVNKSDRRIENLGFEAIYDQTANSEIIATLTNGAAASYIA